MATGVAPVDPRIASRRMRIALVFGGLVAFVTMALLFGIRSDLRQAAELPMYWAKFALPGAVALALLTLMLRLSHPGTRAGHVWLRLVLPWLAVLALAGVVLLRAVPEQRAALILGSTWKTCAFNIALVSSPVFVGVLWAMSGLAPTQLRLAGASAGLLAGAVGTMVYALHCPELAAPFLAIWYLAGILIPVLFWAWVGPRVLRW